MHADTLANNVALTLHNGKPSAEADATLIKLQQVAPNHPLVLDLQAKSNEFDLAASKFAVAA